MSETENLLLPVSRPRGRPPGPSRRKKKRLTERKGQKRKSLMSPCAKVEVKVLSEPTGTSEENISESMQPTTSGNSSTNEEPTVERLSDQDLSNFVVSNRKDSVTLSVNFHDYALPSNIPKNTIQVEDRSVHNEQSPQQNAQDEFPDSELNDIGPRVSELMFEVRQKVDIFLINRWHAIVNDETIHVMLFSAQSNMKMQRNIVFYANGKVELFVHGQPVDVSKILKNCPTSVPLSLSLIQKFVDRIIKIVDEIRTYDVCSGCDNVDYKAGWSSCRLGEVDKNPQSECRYDETFRSFSCKRIVKRTAWRCTECSKIVKPLKKRAELASLQNPHPNTANAYLTEEQKLLKLRDQKEDLDKANKVISRLREKIENLIKAESIKIDNELSADFTEILNSSNVTPAQSIFLQEQIKASQQTKKVGMRWHPTLIRLALSLYITSPSAYQMLQDTGMVKLPSSRTLFDYSRVKPVEGGVDLVVLESLEQKARTFGEKYKKYHVLMADEMYISQNLIFQKSTGAMVGYTTLNDFDKEIENFERYLKADEEVEKEPALAQKVLLFMIKGVSSGIKEVVATYPVATLSVDQMYAWTWHVIAALERHGIAVIAFVSDGFSTNRAFLKKHIPVTVLPSGVIFDTVNKAAPDRVLYFLSDVPHLLKTVRNCLLNSRSDGKKGRRFMQRKGKRITWDFIVNLYEAQKKNTFRKSFKLSAMNVYPDSHARMKVKYAAEVCSRTVAQDIEDQQWEEADELVNFLRLVNDWFDCLNGAHSSVAQKQRNPNLASYTSANDSRFGTMLAFLDYLQEWKEEAETSQSTAHVQGTSNVAETSNAAEQTVNDSVIEEYSLMIAEENVEKETPSSKRQLSKQTLDGIEITTRAFIPMVKFLLSEGTKFINARVFTQDPLEQHFSKLRAGQGGSNNPNYQQVLNRNRALHTIGELGMKRRKGNAGQIVAPVQVTEEPLQKRKKKRVMAADLT